MSINLLIGIGGTGSRIVESALHLCAAGLGPSDLTVAFVEPDRTNGNLQRAVGTLQDYQAAYAAVRRQPASLPGDIPLLKTRIDVPDSGETWSPVPPDTPSIRHLFAYASMDDQGKALFDVLYSRPAADADGASDSEQTMPLNRGFSGRPSVGSAVLAAKAHPERDEFWRHLIEIGGRAEGGEDVRIFLAGSIFGGSGASGFPALAQLIRRRLKEVSSDRIHISGALMLPYFAFTPPRGEGADIAARSEQFLEMSQAALEFYHRKLRDEPDLIRPLYIIGWPRLLMMEVSETGGERQVNPPMPPELYAALAAMRHFGQSRQSRKPALVTVGVGEGQLGWADIPAVSVDVSGGLSPRVALGTMTRFAVGWREVFSDCLSAKRWRQFRRQHWFRRLVSGARLNPSSASVQDSHRALDAYTARYLRWLGSLTGSVLATEDRLHLFDDGQFATDRRAADGCVELRNEGHLRGNPAGFQTLVSDTAPLSLAKIMESLTYGRLAGGAGIGVFVAALYGACVDDEGQATAGGESDDDDDE